VSKGRAQPALSPLSRQCSVSGGMCRGTGKLRSWILASQLEYHTMLFGSARPPLLHRADLTWTRSHTGCHAPHALRWRAVSTDCWRPDTAHSERISRAVCAFTDKICYKKQIRSRKSLNLSRKHHRHHRRSRRVFSATSRASLSLLFQTAECGAQP
jgi:hypothetical protein